MIGTGQPASKRRVERLQRVGGAVALLIAAACAGVARADEPMFGYVNTTDLLPGHKLQIEQWVTRRQGHAGGRYDVTEGRTEADYGLTSDVQVTVYLNYSRLDAEIAAPRGGPRLTPTGPISRDRFDGMTGEAIWRVASPYLAPVGVAALIDATTARGQNSMGFKAILQKNFRDDTVILAGNIRADVGLRETALAASGPSRRRITPVEIALGASYRFRPNWSLALELRDRRKYAQAAEGPDDSGVFLGPTLHYGGQSWFFTLSALQRVGGSHRATPALQTLPGLVYAADRTTLDGLRLRVGRPF